MKKGRLVTKEHIVKDLKRIGTPLKNMGCQNKKRHERSVDHVS